MPYCADHMEAGGLRSIEVMAVEAFSLAMDSVREALDHITGAGIDGSLFALQDDGSAGLCVWRFAEDDEAATCAIGSLSVSEPGREGNAASMLDGFVSEIEDDGCEASGLEE